MNKQAKIALFTGRVPAYYGLLISKIEKTMIVLKAAQEKLLSALQAVAGIVERRETGEFRLAPHVRVSREG